MTQRLLKSYQSKMDVTYVKPKKQIALPLITTMAFWYLIALGHMMMYCCILLVAKQGA